ncbi:MAG: hypothetical protein EOL87_14525 [Spartobacteria bacterium]|nr:hypothetical protein [Spartobacteria bacterium]
MKTRFKRDELAYYHCMSRIVGRQMLLGDAEKEYICQLIRRIEGFTGIRVLTFSIMTNHVHLLLEEPDCKVVISDEELWRRMAFLYSRERLDEIDECWAVWDKASVDADKQRYLRRMHDISEFMKQLKQRFSRWYNRSNQRKGALWDSRFKSVLVEPGRPLRTVAAYIEMNPVRAGMVGDPQFYRFGGFGEAMGGGMAARNGITRIVQDLDGDVKEWEAVSDRYLTRVLMYDEVRRHPEWNDTRHEVLRDKLGKRLELTEYERLTCRCRFFTDGRAIGGRTFVEKVFEENRDHFGPKRRNGAVKIKGGWGDVYALRDVSG